MNPDAQKIYRPRPMIAALLILIAASTAMLYPITFGGASLSGGDLVNHYIPYKDLIVEQVRSGEFPHWNPLTFGGRPLQADIQVGVLYPPNLLFLAMKPANAFDWLVWAHFIWMALGAWLWLRRCVSTDGAAIFGAVALAFGGFFTAQLFSGIVLFIYTGAWLPWMLLGADRLIHRRRASGFLILSTCGALQLLAGAPQIAFYSWLAVGLLVLAVAIADYRKREPEADDRWPFGIPPGGWKALGILTAAATAAAALTAVQWMPTREFLSLSFDRGGGAAWQFVTDGSMRIDWLPTFLAPSLFGRMWNEELYYGSSVGFWEFSGYLGILALAFAAAGTGALLPRAPAPQRRIAWFAVLCIGAWASLAPGHYSPLFKIAYYFIPGFDRFRVPARMVLFYQIGVASLAALGIDRAFHAQGRRARTAAFVALIALGAFGLLMLWAGWRDFDWILRIKRRFDLITAARTNPGAREFIQLFQRLFLQQAGWLALKTIAFAAVAFILFRNRQRRRISFTICAGILFAELALFGANCIRATPDAEFDREFYPRTNARAALSESLAPGQRWTWDDSVFEWTVDQNLLELFPNRPMLYGLPAARGYDPINSRRYVQFHNAMAGRPVDAPAGGFLLAPQFAAPRMLALLNVKTVLSYLNTPGLATAGTMTMQRETAPGGPISPAALRFLDVAEPVGEAFFAHPATLADLETVEPELALARLKSDEFDWRREALVNPDDLAAAGVEFADQPISLNGHSLQLSDRSFGRLRFDVEAPAPALLVLTQSWYPGWRAYIDGEPASTFPADWTLTAAAVPAGAGQVEFIYKPSSFTKGSYITIASISIYMIAAILLLVLRAKKAKLY